MSVTGISGTAAGNSNFIAATPPRLDSRTHLEPFATFVIRFLAYISWIGALMSEANKQLLRRWFDEVWNKGRADAIDEMFDEYGIAHGLADDPANPLRGPRGFRPFHTTFREAFPNMEVVIEDMVAE